MISDLASADMIEFIIWILLERFGCIAGGGGDIHIVAISNAFLTTIQFIP